MALSVERTLRKAKTHERGGQMAEAISCYRQVLTAFPANARAKKALSRLSQTATTPPRQELLAVHKAYTQGHFQAALEAARALAARFPGAEPVWTLLGASATELGQFEMARDAFGNAARIAPASDQAHANLGAVHERLGDHQLAADCFSRALEIRPNTAKYLLSRATAHLAQGKKPAAAQDLSAALVAAPDRSDIAITLAETLCDLGQPTDALTHLATALEQRPGNKDLLICLGTTFLEAGDPARAINTLSPLCDTDAGSAAALNNLASAHFAMGNLPSAAEACEKALALDPNHARAHHNMANIHQQVGHLDKAIASYDRAVALRPDLRAAQAQKLHFQAQICDWQAQTEFDAAADSLGIMGEAVSPFALLAFEDNPARHLQRAVHYASQWPGPRHRFEPSPPRDRLRIGYVSGDLFDHATLFLLNGVLEQHDAERFEVFVYGLNSPRKSAQVDRLRANVARVVDLHDAPDTEIITRLRNDALDIAIDLKGYTMGARPGLFAAGLAPVQISYLGYPGSMGLAAMDYIIADPHVIPPQERPHVSEQVIYLPDSYQPNDDQRVISDAPLSRADHGLPEDAVVLCCFNQSYKICARVFDIWMRVMAQVPETVLWLMAGNQWARDNLRQAAVARGIDPDRLIFAEKLPQDQHLARHRLADLFIDSFACNAHTTASDALYAGLPVVTRPGRQFAARVAASLLSAVDMPELITNDDTSYEALILHLASHPEALADIRQKLAAHLPTAPLFDTKRYTRHLEAGYRAAWDAWQNGETRRDIHVARAEISSACYEPGGSSTTQGPPPAGSPAR